MLVATVHKELIYYNFDISFHNHLIYQQKLYLSLKSLCSSSKTTNLAVMDLEITTIPPVRPTTNFPFDLTSDSPFDNHTVIKCNQYRSRNRTHFLNGANIYEGIPENLLINFIGWIVSLRLSFYLFEMLIF